MEGRPGTPRVASACLGPPRPQLRNGFFTPRLTALCSEVQYEYVNCSLGHLRALLSSHPIFKKPNHPVPNEAIFAVPLHHSHFGSCQGSHPQARRQALVSAILLQLVCGTCGHFQVPSLPMKQGKPWAFAQVLSLLNTTITSLFFFFFLCHGWPMLPHFLEFKIEMGKNPSDWAFPSINSTPLTGFQKSWWKSQGLRLILCFFSPLDIFSPQLYWIIKDSHYPSSSVYPKLLFWHNFLFFLCTLDNINYLWLSQTGYWSLRHLGTSAYRRQIILIFISKKD